MTEWTLDTAHANVEFSIKHMMITTIRGRFQELEVDVNFDEQAPDRSSVVARIKTASITTNQERRDGHLEPRLPRHREVPRDALSEHGHRQGQ